MAKNVSLINCNNVVVRSDVNNFFGVGLSDLVIDSTYSGRTLIASSQGDFETVQIDRILTAADNGKTFLIDASVNDITFFWDLTTMQYCKVSFIRIDNRPAPVNISIDTTTGVGDYIGNAMPYNLNLNQYDTVKFTSVIDTIYNVL